MSDILQFSPSPIHRFAVYELPLMTPSNELTAHRMIVIKNSYNLNVAYTGLERFAGPYTGRAPIIKTRDRHELEYICKALNYILIKQRHVNKVDKVCNITASMIFSYFDNYRTTGKENDPNTFRGQQSVDKCVNAVSSFFANVSVSLDGLALLAVDDLLITQYYKKDRKSKKEFKLFRPRYQEKCCNSHSRPLLRDIPFKALEMLISEAYVHDPMIAFAIVAEATTGTRPAETMNYRREDSPLGAGITFDYIGSGISKIEIDLTHEYQLRSDGVKVGNIKRERMVTVYKLFMADFYKAYMHHQKYLDGKQYEQAYGPMFLTRNGKAMPYKTYQQRFQALVIKHLRPKLLAAETPQLNAFGQLLLTNNLSPHALRHSFSVHLALAGLDCSQIMFYRGDTSPESALNYFQNKGALMDKLNAAHTEAIQGLNILGGLITHGSSL